MTLEEGKEWINNQTFKIAKSYEKTYPHSYLHKDKADNEDKFTEFIRLIRENGIVYTFNKKQYIYLEIDEYIYWEVGRPILAVIILNKAHKNTLKINNQKLAYQSIANKLKNKLQQREIYIEKLINKEIKTDKDYSQIKFLMDNIRRVDGGGKNIIDNYKTKIRYE